MSDPTRHTLRVGDTAEVTTLGGLQIGAVTSLQPVGKQAVAVVDLACGAQVFALLGPAGPLCPFATADEARAIATAAASGRDYRISITTTISILAAALLAAPKVQPQTPEPSP
jgi:Zn-dependent alcohol dehydrogenase